MGLERDERLAFKQLRLIPSHGRKSLEARPASQLAQSDCVMQGAS